uniref:Uncharacterized protein n=1 Tax=Amphimedon queenslandica TaxID=400682 RepID=A0A1X7UPN0_AMPQE
MKIPQRQHHNVRLCRQPGEILCGGNVYSRPGTGCFSFCLWVPARLFLFPMLRDIGVAVHSSPPRVSGSNSGGQGPGPKFRSPPKNLSPLWPAWQYEVAVDRGAPSSIAVITRRLFTAFLPARLKTLS